MEASGGIVLAGGKSARMGRDKALLCINGRSLLERTLEVLRPLVREIVVVADRPDRYALPFGRLVVDILPGRGPVAGILTGLEALGTGCHLVVAADMPRLNPEVLRFLLQEAAPEWDAVVPMLSGGPEPLCAVYRETAASRLRAYLDSGNRSARGALATLRIKTIAEAALRQLDPELDCFLNVNTPEDWTRFHRV